MKKILMRSAMNPLENPDNGKVVTKNLVGGNAGNMVFAFSVMRTLLTEDVIIETKKTDREFSDEEAEQINSEYDCFVLPLANAFRTTFKKELVFLIRLLKRLTIPCIVIGVGVQAEIGEDINKEFNFDELSLQFIKEVLKKSAIIGVRGEVTAAYMKKFGFVEEKDFTVIGCPSMYLHGDELLLKDPVDLTPNSPVAVNRKIKVSGKLHRFLTDASAQFEDYMFVPQGIDDLLLLYAGVPIDRKKFPKIHETYPWKHDSAVCSSGHEIGFANVPSWMEFLRGRDFSFGTRIHGNIVAVISGTPAFIFAPDARITELARYHRIAHMPAKEITDKTDIFSIYEKTDFSQVKVGHKERFFHYLDFLEANGLEHAFGAERKNKKLYFDEKIEELSFQDGIRPLSVVSVSEQAERLEYYYRYLKKKKQSYSEDEIEKYRSMEIRIHDFMEKTPEFLRPVIRKTMNRLIK